MAWSVSAGPQLQDLVGFPIRAARPQATSNRGSCLRSHLFVSRKQPKHCRIQNRTSAAPLVAFMYSVQGHQRALEERLQGLCSRSNAGRLSLSLAPLIP